MNDAKRRIKVVDILSERELALNAGSDEDINEGAIVRILGNKPHQIKDPDTGDVLGEIVRTKAVLRVHEVQERFCLARTYRSKVVNVGGAGSSLTTFNRIFTPPKYVTRVETLRRSPDDPSPLDPDDSVVAVGDYAEVIDEETAEDLPTASAWL